MEGGKFLKVSRRVIFESPEGAYPLWTRGQQVGRKKKEGKQKKKSHQRERGVVQTHGSVRECRAVMQT